MVYISDISAPVLRNVVPITGAVVVFALIGLVVRRSRLFEPMDVFGHTPRISLSDPPHHHHHHPARART